MNKWKIDSNGNIFLKTSAGDTLDIRMEGTWKFYKTNKQICNACLFDKDISEYRFGYLIQTTFDTDVIDTEFFCKSTGKRLHKYNETLVKLWCFHDKSI